MKRLICVLTVVCGFVLLLTSCQKDLTEEIGHPEQIEEGIEGELVLDLGSSDYEQRDVVTRDASSEFFEGHLHSAYIFVIDAGNTAAGCPIVARKYFPDITGLFDETEEGGNKILINRLSMPAVSCRNARIFTITNIGHSEVQGVDNDAELLAQCDKIANMKELLDLSARLKIRTTSEGQEVNVERMQGHHLMSGFFTDFRRQHYIDASTQQLVLKAEQGKIRIYDGNPGEDYMRPFRCMGDTSGEGKPGAVFVHRLDTKVAVNIELSEKLRNTPGAYFRLKSWQVINAPTQEYIFWMDPLKRIPEKQVLNSKVFRRDLNPTETGGWTFTFFQFENYFSHTYPTAACGKEVTSKTIADQYNKEYNLVEKPVSAEEVEQAFSVYPNKFSNFAYTMRELRKKYTAPSGDSGREEYEPNRPGNDDQTIVVYNGDFENAPRNATYLRLEGYYFNPSEPVRRRKDDVRNNLFPDQSLEEFPYWNIEQKPSKLETAATRSRIGEVIYYIHLGYVGGGNYNLQSGDLDRNVSSFGDFKDKVNDYNLLRNHYYNYKIEIAGVNNIKVEATREDGGNVLEQEKQPGAEGEVTESQHFFELDAHYESRNVVLDFRRMPENYDEGFSFALSTPFELFKGTLKKMPNGEIFIVDSKGNPLTNLVNHDLDWIHFVWHGTPEEPSRSLIDPKNQNGISYSKTYGGYEHQKSYLAKHSTLTQVEDADHPYRLLDALEFSKLVWTEYMLWKEKGRPADRQQLTFTIFVDEYFYDYNPCTGATADWTSFSNQPKRKAYFFMENEESSADNHSWYSNSHLVIHQNSIQTLYATSTANGQTVPQVAFGIEGLDEFQARYRCYGRFSGNNQDVAGSGQNVIGTSLDNGLYNTMQWYNDAKDSNNEAKIIDWNTALSYFDEKGRMEEITDQNFTENDDRGRNGRRAQWAVYPRNRDLNRNGRLDPDEIRWFLPAIDQYTLCFLGGRPVFENPLFERDRAIVVKNSSFVSDWIHNVPLAHYMSSSNIAKNRIFWAEEGCSKGDYAQANEHGTYGIRMARMLTNHGVANTGVVFENPNTPKTALEQDPLFIVTHTPNGMPVKYEERENGTNYYILLNKLNVNALRDFIDKGELGYHTHEQKGNWLPRRFKIAKNRLGYTSYQNAQDYDRNVKIDGVPRTWWQVSGFWSKDNVPGGQNGIYYYRGPERSLAYDYHEESSGSDLHHWRLPNLREAAIMSMAFPQKWFGNNPITSATESENLGPNSTNVPYWSIQSNIIGRLQKDNGQTEDPDKTVKFWVRGVMDVK